MKMARLYRIARYLMHFLMEILSGIAFQWRTKRKRERICQCRCELYFFICRSLNWAWILIKPVGNAVDFGGLSVLAEGLGITYELVS